MRAAFKNRYLITYLAVICLIGACQNSSDVGDHSRDILDRAASIYKQLSVESSPKNGYPRAILDEGKWNLVPPSDWTSGFFPGILWQLFDYSGDSALLVEAGRWTHGLADQTTAPTHDVGFMIYNSYGRGFHLTGDESYRQKALEAAGNLASRFNPEVGAIRSWDWGDFKYPVIIDNMMNLELLMWAARNGGDSSWSDIAITHAKTTIKNHIRPDGGTWHIVDYDPKSGEILRKMTWQGSSDQSLWSRGQAWGLYGFTLMYRETGDTLFLNTAVRLADRFLDGLMQNTVPYWDYDAGKADSTQPKDASAAAIAASALWDLGELAKQDSLKERYREASLKLVKNLSTDDYLAYEKDLPALLLHATGHKPHGSEIDVPIIYADYYFIEALIKQAT